MSTLAELLVRLGVDDAQFTQKMKRAGKTTESFSDSALAATRNLGLAAATGVAAAAALGALVTRQADAIAGYQDLAEKIGDSAENITRLKTAADISGTALDEIGQASIKLTASLSKQDEESKGAAQAIKALGLNFDAFKQQSPVEQMTTLADQFAKFEDGAGKTATAVALFGKSGAAVIPFLNDLADDTERSIKLTAQQIEQADQFTKNIARMGSEVSTLGQQYSAVLIPVLDDVLMAFREVSKQVLNARDAQGQLTGQEAIREWAQNAAIDLAIIGEALVGVIKLASSVGSSFGVMAADVGYAFTALQANLGLIDNGEAEKALAARNAALEKANRRWSDLWNYNGTALSDALRKQFRELDAASQQLAAFDPLASVKKTLVDSGPLIFRPEVKIEPFMTPLTSGVMPPKPKLRTDYGDAGGAKTGKAVRDQISEAERYLTTLREQVAVLGLNTDAAELYRIKMADGVTPAQIAQAEALIATRAAFDQQREITSYLDGLQQQVDLLGKSTSEAELYKFALMDGVTPAQLAQAQALRATLDAQEQFNKNQAKSLSIIEATRTPLEQYVKQLDELMNLQKLGVSGGGIDSNTYDRAVEQARKAYEESGKIAKDELKGINAFADQAARNIQDSLAQAIIDGFDGGAKGALRSFANFLAQASAQALAADITSAIFGKGKGDGGSVDLFGGLAESLGNLFGKSGSNSGSSLPSGGFLSGSAFAALPALSGSSGIGGDLFKGPNGDSFSSLIGDFGGLLGDAKSGDTLGGQLGDFGKLLGDGGLGGILGSLSSSLGSLFGGGSGGGGGSFFSSLAGLFGSAAAGSAGGGGAGFISGLGFADGGSPPVGMASLVGEGGPELFVPSSAGTIIPNGDLAGLFGQQQAPQVNVKVVQVSSIEEAKGFLGSADGGQLIVTQIGKNPAAVRAALGIGR